jgi:hypothetical protein
MENKPSKSLTSLQKWLVFAIILGGILIRMVDLTDAPVDFHPTRQFRGATIARSIYVDSLPESHPDYGSKGGGMVASFQDLEPLILENIMAFLYRVFGGEELWMVRIFNAVLWGIGGWVLFNIVAYAVGIPSAFISLMYFTFLPFGVYASRSFQSDPMMTVGVIVSVYLAHTFFDNPTWKNTIALALVAGITILIKIVAIYLIGGMMVALVLHRGLEKTIRDVKIWFIGIVMLVIPASYYVFPGEDAVAGNASSWMIQMLPLLKKPDFWIGWAKRLFAFGAVSALISGLGVLMILLYWNSKKSTNQSLGEKLLLGSLVGYFLYGLSFPHHIPTHSYYHIQLIPLVGWAVGFGIHTILTWAESKKLPLQKISWIIMTVWLVFVAQKSINNLLLKDYRNEAPYWESIGEIVPKDGNTIGLVSYYGFLLRYYGGELVAVWPSAADQALAKTRGEEITNFIDYFEDKTEGNQYFLITAINQLEAQKDLHDHLYTNFEIADEGAGYILFSLQN